MRYSLALVAVALNLYSVAILRMENYDSAAGSLGWLGSLGLLLLAFVGHRPAPMTATDAGIGDVEARTDLALPRRVERVIFVGLLLLAFGLRLYRLDDWTTGMHGDEGEAGMDALHILEGPPVSPFATGWFGQPNFYYWALALTMQVFGTGLGGLRMFATLAGTAMFLPFYPLVRGLFGVRTAILASLFLAISAVTIHFSRMEFSNITTPLALVTGCYFLGRGLREQRLRDFVLAGYGFVAGMYFYLGGRLAPLIAAGFLAYLLVLLPLVRLPGAYRVWRRALPGVGRGRALLGAVGAQARAVGRYAGAVVVFGLAGLCFATPWLAYFDDHAAILNARINDKLIFNNPDRMMEQHRANHDPLYLGLRLPTAIDILPNPVVFEHTLVSVKIADDGFWPRALWGQLTTTLSILTYRWDTSSVYTFTGAPAAKPFEAVLIILGIAWALWRWRDPRMTLLSIWFWATIVAGGVLTIDAPYMARIIGIVPVLAVFAALPLNKLVAEFLRIVSRFGQAPAALRGGHLVSGLALAGVLGLLGWQNFHDYYQGALATTPLPFPEVTGQAYFVRQVRAAALAAGRPAPKFYDLGAHLIYWLHGDNRFLNHGTPGLDMGNPSDELPVVNNGDRDVVFMVWDLNRHYLPVLHAYYPEGSEAPFRYGSDDPLAYLFTSYHVTREQIDARRVLTATYTSADGVVVHRPETALGRVGAPPAGLAYPAAARWTGYLVAPSFGRYRFRLAGPPAGRLVIDGQAVLTGTTTILPVEATLILARGAHSVELAAPLATEAARPAVEWSWENAPFVPIPRAYLWAGPGRAFLGEVRALGGSGDPFGPLPPDAPGTGTPPVILRRVDGFLGFRDAPGALSFGTPLVAAWTGTLDLAAAGTYGFSLFSNGAATIFIDGAEVAANRQAGPDPHGAAGLVNLAPGPHTVEVRYTWATGSGYLEVYWTPPGEARQLLGPAGPAARGGAWAPGTVSEPGILARPLTEARAAPQAAGTFDLHGVAQAPRGLAVGPAGRVYLADTGHRRVAVLDRAGALVGTWGEEGKGPGEFVAPEDVVVGADGKIYVLDSSLPRIQVFTATGVLDHIITGSSWCAPVGLGLGPDGLLYIADACANQVHKYTPAGRPLAEYGGATPATQLDQPVDVAVGADGAIYVADLRGRVVELDPADGTIRRSWPLRVGSDYGGSNLAVTGRALYLTSPTDGTLTVINTLEGWVATYGRPGSGPGTFAAPVGVTTDRDGKVYLGEAAGLRIQVFVNLADR